MVAEAKFRHAPLVCGVLVSVLIYLVSYNGFTFFKNESIRKSHENMNQVLEHSKFAFNNDLLSETPFPTPSPFVIPDSELNPQQLAKKRCTAVKKWIQQDCNDDRAMFRDDMSSRLVLNFSHGRWINLIQMVTEMYPDQKEEIAKLEGDLRSHSNLTIREARHQLAHIDSKNLFNHWANFYYNKHEGCVCNVANAWKMAVNAIWMPKQCSIPLTSRLKHERYQLNESYSVNIPPRMNIIAMGNSYLGAMSFGVQNMIETDKDVTHIRLPNQNKCITFDDSSNTSWSWSECVRGDDTFQRPKPVTVMDNADGSRWWRLKNSFVSCFFEREVIGMFEAAMEGNPITDLDILVVNKGNTVMGQTHGHPVAEFICNRKLQSAEHTLPSKTDVNKLRKELALQHFNGLILESPEVFFTPNDSGDNSYNFNFRWPLTFNKEYQCQADGSYQCEKKMSHQCKPGHPDWAAEWLVTDFWLEYCNKYGQL